MFIRIVKDNTVTDWRFTDPDTKKTYETVFKLRPVPEDTQKKYRKAHTTFDRDRSGRHEVLDVTAYVNDCLNYGIVDWDVVQVRDEDTGKVIELPCEREWKISLPEVVKAGIIRFCVGREIEDIAREANDGGAGSDPNATSGSGASGGKTMPESRPVAVS